MKKLPKFNYINRGLRLEEAKSINSSLSALGNVITALGCPNKNGFVPYRASKLTRVLQNSLSSQSKISLIATISNDPNNFHETLSTLAFAQRCKEMLLKPRINPAIEESENLDQFMQKMQQEVIISQLNQNLREHNADGETYTVIFQKGTRV